jgi:hypothetical protein
LKVRESLMYPESVNDGRQDNEFAAAHASTAAARRLAASHLIPAFARRRPIRAVLLAAAMFAIPYSLARHHGDVNGHRPASAAPPAGFSKALPMGPVAIENLPDNSSSAWHPPIGVDRRNETLDQLTLDFTSRQTPNPPARFPAGRQALSLPGDAAKTPARGPAPAQGPAPAEAPAAAPAALPAVADHDKKEVSDHKGPEHKLASRDVSSHDVAPSSTATPPFDDIDQYLWTVYERSSTKRDSSGDFTWKDEAAAARLGLVTKQYVIEGMDPDFRELLYNLGHAMDAAGLNWTILSGFRDDYRQGLASGYKAHVGNSFHGGSRATGGYGHGCAADIEASNGENADNSAIWKFVDQHGEKFGIFRPMKGIDPAHVQPLGGWHDVAFNLRKEGVGPNSYLPASIDNGDGAKVTPLVDTRSGVSEAQFDCIRSHHHPDFRLAGFAHRHGFMHRAMVFHPGRMHRFGRRRMVVEAGGRDRGASLEAVDGQAGAIVEKHAKAEASGNNRRDARRGKEASVSAERTRWGVRHDAKGSEAKGSEAKGSEAKGSEAKGSEAKGSEAKGSEAKGSEAKGSNVADGRHVGDRRGQKHVVAESAARQAKAKSHVADRADAPDRNEKKL